MISDVVLDTVNPIKSTSDVFGGETVSTIYLSMESAVAKGPPGSNLSSISVLAPREIGPPGQVVSVNSSPRFPAQTSSNNDLEDTTSKNTRLLKRRSRDDLHCQIGDETDTPSESAVQVAKPQHETENEKDDSFYRFETEMQNAILSQRNKRVLLSRLFEVAPRGLLTVINFCRRGIGVEEALLLKKAIVGNPHLTVLKLSYNNLCDTGAAIIASSLTEDGNRHHQISLLDLGFNCIGDVGCGYLALHCVAGNHCLQSLYLSGNQIGEKGALSIAGAILHGTSLQSLYLAANQIGPVGIKTIAGAIAKNEVKTISARIEGNDQHRRSFRVLDFGSTSMTSVGFIAIPGMLLSNASLQSICLSNNNLDDQDMLVLSQALTQNKMVPLESLYLSFNEISCVGVESLMNALWGSSTLRHLKLDNNNMQDRGAQLCAVIQSSIELETLDISFNKITTIGIKALMKNLSENNSLQSFSMCGIPIDQKASKAVSYALAYNTSLQAFHVDNCSTGYASQRHIVAGVVSNRKSALRVLTGFYLSPIALTLGMPRLPDAWTNDQVLGFFRVMWDQWLLKSRQGSGPRVDESIRGPAPPAAVAAAAKIAFASLGHASPADLFRTEPHQRPLVERSPVEPAGTAMLERSDSGTFRVPLFTVSSEIGISDFVDGEIKAAAISNGAPAPSMAMVRCSQVDPRRRHRNMQWLRIHFRALGDISRLPFNNAHLWQLHQYFFSPPIDIDNQATSSFRSPEPVQIHFDNVLLSSQDQVDSVGLNSIDSMKLNSHKRRPESVPSDVSAHVAKRPKSLQLRIAYYPRIMSKIQSLGARSTMDTLSLLRQLKYTERVIFANRNPYSGDSPIQSDLLDHADIDMILLDLL